LFDWWNLSILLTCYQPQHHQHFGSFWVKFMPFDIVQQITIQLYPRWLSVFEMLELRPIFDFHFLPKKKGYTCCLTLRCWRTGAIPADSMCNPIAKRRQASDKNLNPTSNIYAIGSETFFPIHHFGEGLHRSSKSISL